MEKKLKKNNNKFKFEHYMIIKTITVICFVFSLSILSAPFIIYQKEGFTKNIFFYFNNLLEFLIKNYFATIPLFIGAFLFVYLFLMKKLKEPDK